MRTIAALSMLIALSSQAHAAPIVWHKVSDNAVEDANAKRETKAERSAYEDQVAAVENRKDGIDDAREGRKDARQARGEARSIRNDARKEWRQAKRGKGDLAVATMTYEAAERAFLESKDRVDLDKEMVSFSKSQKRLAKARESRARANLELVEAAAVDKKTQRFEKQAARIRDRVAEIRSEHELERVALAERHQDFFGMEDLAATYVIYTSEPTPVATKMDFNTWTTEYVKATKAQNDEQHQVQAGWHSVHFDLGSAKLDAADKAALDEAAAYLRQHRGMDIVLEGHTDKTGSRAFNRELAWDRAQTVERYLLDHGVWTSQLDTMAYGESQPLVDTNRANAWNRRVELTSASEATMDGTADAGR